MPSSKLEILFESSDYVAINKPAGLAVIPGRGEETSALEELAAQLNLPWTGKEDPRLRVLHRIDKETSGVVVFAKNKPAQRHVSEQFQNNLVEKQYTTLVAGRPGSDEGEINEPIDRHPTSVKRMIVTKHGRPARTLWKVEARFRNGLSLLRIYPKTGKTHQIRVHLQHIGLPLAIDPLYNAKPPAKAPLYLSSFKRGYRAKEGEERPLMERLTLHAERLAFKGLNGEPIEITAPLPKDFRATVNMLYKYASA